MTTTEIIHKLKTAAAELGRDGILSDPTDDTILLAAAELAEGCESVDLLTLGDNGRNAICAAYDAATE